MARLVPYATSPLETLRANGRITAARTVDMSDLSAASGLSSQEILEDLRGER